MTVSVALPQPPRAPQAPWLGALALALVLHLGAWQAWRWVQGAADAGQGVTTHATVARVLAQPAYAPASPTSLDPSTTPAAHVAPQASDSPDAVAPQPPVESTQAAHATQAMHSAPAAAPPPTDIIELGQGTLVEVQLNSSDNMAATHEAMAPTRYVSADDLDVTARPVAGWVLDEQVLLGVRKGRLVLKLWVSDTGVIDGFAVVGSQPEGDWVLRALKPFGMTVMQPGFKNGRAVPSTLVVEIASEDEGFR
jgi:hypothetical protein